MLRPPDLLDVTEQIADLLDRQGVFQGQTAASVLQNQQSAVTARGSRRTSAAFTELTGSKRVCPREKAAFRLLCLQALVDFPDSPFSDERVGMIGRRESGLP